MNIKESIQGFDSAIAHLQSRSHALGNSGDIVYEGAINKKLAQIVLESMEGNRNVLQALDNITYNSAYSQKFSAEMYGAEKCREENERLYKQSTQAIINILQQERENLIRRLQEEERESDRILQIKNNKIQVWTLIFSAIAAMGTIAALLMTFVK